MAHATSPTNNLNRFPQFMKDGEVFETASDEEPEVDVSEAASSQQSGVWREYVDQLDTVLGTADTTGRHHQRSASEDAQPEEDGTVTLRRAPHRSATSASQYARRMQDAFDELCSTLEEPPMEGDGTRGNYRLRPPTVSGLPLSKQQDSNGTWPRRRHRLSSSLRNIEAMFEEGPLDGPVAPSGPRAGRFPNASERASPLTGSRSDLFLAWEDDNFGRLSTQLADLDKKIHSMSTNQSQIESQNMALQRENKMLKERLMYMEDQMRDDDRKAKEQINREKDLFNEKLTRMNKQHQQEGDEFREEVHKLELENANIRLELTKIRAEAERCKLEKQRLEEKLENSESKLGAVTEETEKFREYSRKKIEELKKSRDASAKSMEEMHRELVELRSRGSGSKFFSSGGGGANAGGGAGGEDLQSRYREVQELVKRLTLENRDLSEQLDEAKAELFTRSVEEGRRLLARGQVSWQAELNGCSQDELIALITKEKDTSQQLRDYIDHILGRIMEEYPTLLEKHF